VLQGRGGARPAFAFPSARLLAARSLAQWAVKPSCGCLALRRGSLRAVRGCCPLPSATHLTPTQPSQSASILTAGAARRRASRAARGDGWMGRDAGGAGDTGEAGARVLGAKGRGDGRNRRGTLHMLQEARRRWRGGGQSAKGNRGGGRRLRAGGAGRPLGHLPARQCSPAACGGRGIWRGGVRGRRGPKTEQGPRAGGLLAVGVGAPRGGAHRAGGGRRRQWGAQPWRAHRVQGCESISAAGGAV
jgi:hypothetical protein